MPKLSGGDEAIVVAVEDLESTLGQQSRALMRSQAYLEGLANLLLRVRVLHFPGHHREEL